MTIDRFSRYLKFYRMRKSLSDDKFINLYTVERILGIYKRHILCYRRLHNPQLNIDKTVKYLIEMLSIRFCAFNEQYSVS